MGSRRRAARKSRPFPPAWLSGAADIDGGKTVVLQESAHQLDQEAGVVVGAPISLKRSMYVAWARVLDCSVSRTSSSKWWPCIDGPGTAQRDGCILRRTVVLLR